MRPSKQKIDDSKPAYRVQQRRKDTPFRCLVLANPGLVTLLNDMYDAIIFACKYMAWRLKGEEFLGDIRKYHVKARLLQKFLLLTVQREMIGQNL